MDELTQFPDVKVLETESVGGLSARLPRKHKYFTLLLAWDAPTNDVTELARYLQPIIEGGLVYFCAWGKNCEAVHDAVDHCALMRGQKAGEEGALVMTTWHDDEPLREAVWFFKNMAIPEDSKVQADCERYAVAVGNPNWAESMKELLAEAP